MAATKLQRNWTAVAFNSVTITRVTGVNFDPGGNLIGFLGDGDIYPEVIVAQDCKPTASVESGDIGTLMGFAPGTVASLTATHNDAKLAVGGAINYTLANAVVKSTPANGPRGQFGSGTLSLEAFSSDGTTSPLSFTRT